MWAPQIGALWKSVGKACEWKHPWAPTAKALYKRVTTAVLVFLRDTKVRRMDSSAPCGGAGGLEELELCPTVQSWESLWVLKIVVP